jgi:hypothetical protein
MVANGIKCSRQAIAFVVVVTISEAQNHVQDMKSNISSRE